MVQDCCREINGPMPPLVVLLFQQISLYLDLLSYVDLVVCGGNRENNRKRQKCVFFRYKIPLYLKKTLFKTSIFIIWYPRFPNLVPFVSTTNAVMRFTSSVFYGLHWTAAIYHTIFVLPNNYISIFSFVSKFMTLIFTFNRCTMSTYIRPAISSQYQSSTNFLAYLEYLAFHVNTCLFSCSCIYVYNSSCF